MGLYFDEVNGGECTYKPWTPMCGGRRLLTTTSSSKDATHYRRMKLCAHSRTFAVDYDCSIRSNGNYPYVEDVCNGILFECTLDSLLDEIAYNIGYIPIGSRYSSILLRKHNALVIFHATAQFWQQEYLLKQYKTLNSHITSNVLFFLKTFDETFKNNVKTTSKEYHIFEGQ